MDQRNLGCSMSSAALLCCRQCRRDRNSFTCRPLRHEDEDDDVLGAEENPNGSYFTDGDEATHLYRPRGCPCEGSGDVFGSVITDPSDFYIHGTLDEDRDAPELWTGHIFPYCDHTTSHDVHHPHGYSHRSEGNSCACLFRPTESCEGVSEQWTCSPFPCLGVSKTLLVGVEVDIVEELEFEDTEVLEEPVMPDMLSQQVLTESGPTLTHEDQLLL
ncbi:uncharacterized protein LOC121721474 [Alosa sapidissima]|uniref:uncharacterized protein LOC121721474 n=1 Tax=Alosa sapidissima TaxID=34773 RepID=UPI001C0A3F65|nr:uncharacterized protein LOC121721474 [Alosa sapidissima]XP_041964387.1 uncharacterized protein LOC121721474 [Alosa sapidissima]